MMRANALALLLVVSVALPALAQAIPPAPIPAGLAAAMGRAGQAPATDLDAGRGPARAPPPAIPPAAPAVHETHGAGGHAPHFAVAAAPTPVLLNPDGTAGAPAACNAGTRVREVQPIQFCCPKTLVPFAVNGGQDRFDYRSCPFRVYDTAVVPVNYRFGNPQIAMNPSNEEEVAFCSLHSDADPEGPTPRSRVSTESHTTFTSFDQGITWEDQPIFEGEGLGESSSCAMDGDGNLYIGYLWSKANGNETTGYASAIGLYKAGTTHDRDAVFESYNHGYVIQSRTANNPIPTMHLVDVPAYVPPPPELANATAQPPANETDIGDAAIPTVNATEERVAVVWFEHTPKDKYMDGPRQLGGWIDAAFTDTGGSDNWTRLADDQLIGPCMDASNPVAFDGKLYVVCQVDRGYGARSRARIGENDVWRIDPVAGTTELVETTYVVGGHPLLAASSDGYFVLVTTRHTGEDGAEVHAAFGWYGKGWSSVGADLGLELHRLAGAQPVLDAGINALAISDVEKTAIFEYMEWHAPRAPTDLPIAPPDPNNPQAPTPRLTDFQKIMVTFNSCNFPIAAAAMQLGTGVDPDNFDAYQERPSIFDDNQDGILQYHEDTGGDLFYIAVNDYGAMQYGAVLTAASSTLCPVPPPPPPVPPLPVPQALSVSNAAVTTVGSVLAVTSIASILYMVTVKRRAPHLAVAEDK